MNECNCNDFEIVERRKHYYDDEYDIIMKCKNCNRIYKDCRHNINNSEILEERILLKEEINIYMKSWEKGIMRTKFRCLECDNIFFRDRKIINKQEKYKYEMETDTKFT